MLSDAKSAGRQLLGACSSGSASAARAFALRSLCQAGAGSACGNRSLLQKYPWGKRVTLSPVFCSLPDLWRAQTPLVNRTEVLDTHPFTTVPRYATLTDDTDRLHCASPRCRQAWSLQQRARAHREHLRGCSALSCSTGSSQSRGREGASC